MSTVLWVAALTFAVLLVHGYHPGAEDGGIYAAGVYLHLHPALFPHDAEFVRAPSSYSAFASLLAKISLVFRITPEWTLLLAHLATIALTLFAVHRICRVCGYDRGERVGAMALLAAWWTLPVAGTSLTIGDPYVTARSFSMPLSLLAISFALERWRDVNGRWRAAPVLRCVACIVAGAMMHRLMFGFAVMLVLLVRARSARPWLVYVAAVCTCSLVVVMAIYLPALPEPAALVHAELTRQYWFLSEWRWYEVCGLIAPLLLFAARLQNEQRGAARDLLVSAVVAGLLSVLIALLFAREGAPKHIIARLQPLRMFMLLYVFLGIELSRITMHFARATSSRVSGAGLKRVVGALPLSLAAIAAVCMYFVQADSFSSSWHVEVPWKERGEVNPWISAFLWCKQNTKEDAVFAIDPTYIHQPKNDAQTFRAHALRSVLPDQSKDGGEAAVAPELAERWERGYAAQVNLNSLSDSERLARLQPLGVSWCILGASAPTHLTCPYQNQAVKVCRL